MHRIWALKFIAALTTRLGKEGIQPYLSQVMQPLYRIQESGSAPNTDEVRRQRDGIVNRAAYVAAVCQADCKDMGCYARSTAHCASM